MSHKVTLIKSWTNFQGRVYPVGQVLIVDKELRQQLIDEGVASIYEGEYPPKEKVKTDFFKPNKQKGDGSSKRK